MQWLAQIAEFFGGAGGLWKPGAGNKKGRGLVACGLGENSFNYRLRE